MHSWQQFFALLQILIMMDFKYTYLDSGKSLGTRISH